MRRSKRRFPLIIKGESVYIMHLVRHSLFLRYGFGIPATA
jgi:hypothetical protein